MALRTWHTIKARYCHHAGAQVGLEAEVVYPAEWLPDQPPRTLAHRCTHGITCNLEARPTCLWSGTNPTYDPLTSY